MKQRLFAVILALLLGVLTSADPASLRAQDEFIDPTGGLLITFVSNRTGDSDIYVMDATGRNQRNLSQNSAEDYSPTWSKDGLRVAFVSERDENQEIYAVNYQTRTSENLTKLPNSNESAPAWSPIDINMLAFVSDMADADTQDIYLMELSTGNITRLTTDSRPKHDMVWMPDGKGLVYTMNREGEGEQIILLTVATKQVRLLTSIGKNNEQVSIAAGDDTALCLMFQTNRFADRWQVFEMRDNGDEQEAVVSIQPNAGYPSLSPDSAFLLYVSDTQQSDEIYLARSKPKCNGGDGSIEDLARLTSNLVSDHSPAWQPVVVVSEIPEAVDGGTQVASTEDVFSTGVNQSFNTDLLLRDTLPISDLFARNGVDVWHDMGWRGVGQKIAVLDTGFVGLTPFIDNVMGGRAVSVEGDAAAYNSDVSGNDHGTRVLEVIYSVAPEADLFACRYLNLSQFDGCIDWALSNGVKIINHSAGLPLLPLDGTNRFSQSAQRAVQEGVLWINSAGNFAKGYVSQQASDVNGDGFVDFNQPDNILRVENAGFYRGNVIVSWIRTDMSDLSMPDNVQFDLEILSLNTLDPIGREVITESASDDRYRRILVTTDGGFGLRVKPTVPLSPTQISAFRIVLFAEFLEIGGGVQEGSVLAPGDAENVITVGAVTGRSNQIAPFSSFGLLDVRRGKPDLVAYGALYLDARRFSNPLDAAFIGTSAAAPVVAGAAALIWEANPEFSWDEMYNFMRRSAVVDTGVNDQALGRGILQLPDPPIKVAGETVDAAAPFVVFVTPTPSPIDIGLQCPGAITPRLDIGVRGFILKNLDILGGLRLRSEPSTASTRTILAQLPAGTQFTTLEGPRCNENVFWWRIELDDGTTGWMLEGSNDLVRHNDGGYLLAPISLERALYLGMDKREPCTAPPTQLDVGDTAVLVKGGMTVYQEIEQKREYRNQLERGLHLAILGGPRCEGQANRVMRWYIRVLDGNQAGLEGWVAESIPADRFMQRDSSSAGPTSTPAETKLAATSVVAAMTVGAPLPTPVPTTDSSAAVSSDTLKCNIRFTQRVNTRTGPGTTFDIARAQDQGTRIRAVGYTLDSSGMKWWRLIDRTWVRIDTVDARNPNCDALSATRLDEPLPTLNASFPSNRTTVPAGARKLGGGEGLTTGRQMDNGEIELEGYCGGFGYYLQTTSSSFVCQNGEGATMFTLETADYDLACQMTYKNDSAFSITSGPKQWQCYGK